MACCGRSEEVMNHLVLGFKSRKSMAKAEVLYLGPDGNEAREKLHEPGEGFVRTELSYANPVKYRHFNTSDEVAAAAKAKEAADEAAAKVEAERERIKAERAAAEAKAKKPDPKSKDKAK